MGDSATIYQKLIATTVLALPHVEVCLPFDTDVCDSTAGCVLMQNNPDDAEKLLVYWSRTVNAAGLNVRTTHSECLALALALTLQSNYFVGKSLTILTGYDFLNGSSTSLIRKDDWPVGDFVYLILTLVVCKEKVTKAKRQRHYGDVKLW